jgi:hypothetical protein
MEYSSFAISKDFVNYGISNLKKYYTYPKYLEILGYFDPVIHVDKDKDEYKKHPNFIMILGDHSLPVFMKKINNKSLLLQPAQKACVPSSIAMVYYDTHSSDASILDNIKKNQNIYNILLQAANQTSCTKIEKMDFFGLKIKPISITFLDLRDFYITLQRLFNSGNVSALIQNIDSEEISGHTIVVDGFQIVDKIAGVVIRDPYNGIYGIIPFIDFVQSIQESITIKDKTGDIILDPDEDNTDLLIDDSKSKVFSTFGV